MAKDIYELSDEHFEYYSNNPGVKYRPLFTLLKTKIEEDKDNPYSNELSDIVMHYARFFSGISEGIAQAFKQDDLIHVSADGENLLTAYSLYIASRVMSKDLEDKIEEATSNVMTQSDKPKELIKWGDTTYNNIKTALENLVLFVSSSNTNPANAIKDFFDYYGNFLNADINKKINRNIYTKIKDIEWKIGPYTVGLRNIIQKNGTNVPIHKKEKGQFYTPLKYLSIPKDRVLPKNRIIGDVNIINYLKDIIDYLFLYNPKFDKNPMQEKRLFFSNFLLEGPSGEGKGTVCYYLINYFENFSKQNGLKSFVTSFDIFTSWKDGNIQKIKSQFEQIINEKKIFLIFLDEVTQYLKKGNGQDQSREDVVLEFQKFMDGEYPNKGNYLLLATTNVYDELPKAIRRRFLTFNWAGAETPEQKALLYRYKLEEGIRKGYVALSDGEFSKCGQLSYNYGITGSGIDTICKYALNKNVKPELKSAVWRLRNDYQGQLDAIDTHRYKIDYPLLENEITQFHQRLTNAKQNSMEYRVN